METLPLTFWDKMAKRYPHFYEPSMAKDVDFIFRWCESHGVVFKDTSILDIGCGTGTMAIPLAQKGSTVTAIDISDTMLSLLKADAHAYHVDHLITVVQSDWESFTPAPDYDIVIASMTPAVAQAEHLDKMFHVAQKIGIYVGWGSYRTNAFVDELLRSHRQEDTCSSAGCFRVDNFMQYLDQKSVPYEYTLFDTQWSDPYTLQDAKEYAYEQLQRRSLTGDEKSIDALIERYQQEGIVTITTKAQKGIVLWRHN